MASFLDTILDTIVVQIGSLSLQIGDNAVPVARRKAARFEEGIDPVPMVQVVSHGKPDSDRPFDSEGHRWREYVPLVVLLSAGNRDNVSQESALLQIRASIIDLCKVKFGLGVSAAGQVLWALLEADHPPLDPKAFPANYDASVIAVRFACVE